MPARYRPRPRAQLRRSRPRTVWVGSQAGGLTFTTGQTRIFDLLSNLEVAGVSKLGIVVVRQLLSLRLTFNLSSDSWFLGTIVTRNEDIGGSVPNVLAQPGLPWMMTDEVFPTASAATADNAIAQHYDIRSRRRVPGLDSTLALSATSNAASNITLSYFARVLVTLP